jgi:hypothetical protein
LKVGSVSAGSFDLPTLNWSDHTLDTTGLQPGSYVVTSKLSDGSKHGVASCRASFTVKQPHPPVISCSADPATVLARGTSAINSKASSPAGCRLIYGYSASAGDISGNASSATLNTGSGQPGTITATCNVAVTVFRR